MRHDLNLTTDRPTFVTHLECSLTGVRYAADQLHGLSAAGKPLLVRYDLDGVRAALTKGVLAQRPMDLWRWRELLPVRNTSNIVSLGENATPLVALPRTAARLGGAHLIAKDEGRLPTASFKARGLVMAVSMAKELGVTQIAMPTNGNAGAALAAYAAVAGMEAIIFCPDDTPEINVREIAAQGARVYCVNGLIDDCGAIVGQGAKERGWFDFSTLKEPYRIEGKKTMGLELAEQLGWELPDAIFYPTGGGTGLIGMWKAFDELEQIGFIGSKRPKMFAVQAEGCAPMVRAFDAGVEFAERWEDAHTIAMGIRVPRAVGDFLILRAVRESGGAALAVPDAAIMAAVRDVARDDGLLLCPEGGATLAAYSRALDEGLIGREDRAVLFNCASGLKYPLEDHSRRLDRHMAIDFAAL
ncbi:MAG: threonine synthase [Sphingobium sp.]|uniref:threonine synthase n=1 Tax=Sphingobium sp. TaxID=1912891 RepID=UPI000C645564|nr:threonine synthase [Sphingobium sp.]MBU0659825.1 threonine synthase [Alphaproteobacteria bacterium]MBA4753580.1 threonine synthase [Sphingobium sp.]MBS88965.1 threonine synthase [Sphingobium sp.]MBU0868021.1 threonine synthase [Alphaproteobacteria bacterium]MBU1259244.1 threonine synthase [Alphaproteobacteria bacterium]